MAQFMITKQIGIAERYVSKTRGAGQLNRTRHYTMTVCSLALALGACAPSNIGITTSPPATVIALAATATALPATATATAQNTATASATQTVAPSATPSPSDTATSSPTPVPSSTPTPTPSPRPTRRPATSTFTPTATDSQPTAPLYPKTPIVAWNAVAFLQSITDSRNSTHDFYDYHGRATVGATGNCNYFWNDYGIWERQPGFTNVPAAWYPLYYRLRVILQNVQIGVQPVVKVCEVGGGHIDDSDDQKILAALATAVDQLDQLATDAKATAP